MMKHIILYGPGSSPDILVGENEAEIIREKFSKGEGFEVKSGNALIIVREHMCWAMRIEDFNDRRGQ